MHTLLFCNIAAETCLCIHVFYLCRYILHVHVCTRISLYALYRIMGTSIAIVILNNYYYYCMTIETCCYTTDDSETCGSCFEKLKDTVISKYVLPFCCACPCPVMVLTATATTETPKEFICKLNDPVLAIASINQVNISYSVHELKFQHSLQGM